MKRVVFVLILSALPIPLTAQWLNYRTPGTPRTADGKPNLTATAPRTTDGKPDLSGLWQKISDANNVAADLKPGEIQPWAEALVKERAENLQKDYMGIQCLPLGPSYSYSARKAKIVQNPGLIVMLDEDLTIVRFSWTGVHWRPTQFRAGWGIRWDIGRETRWW